MKTINPMKCISRPENHFILYFSGQQIIFAGFILGLLTGISISYIIF